MFTTHEGRSFERTAHFIWDLLINWSDDNKALKASNADGGSLLNLHREWAEKLGERVFSQLKGRHEDYVAERKKNGRHHFEVRFKHLNQIGLPEVKQFRKRQLELEQESWRREIAEEAMIRPELNPMILMELKVRR